MRNLSSYLAGVLLLTFLAPTSLLAVEKPVVATRSEQVAPLPPEGRWTRSPEQTRAILLIHGFQVHLYEESVPLAGLHSWQQPGSLLVKELAKQGDVFAFAYGQDAALVKVLAENGVGAAVARLRRLGYREIVLVGHSAGGLIAREFVEDDPDAGVTRVVQVCAPNGGTAWAETPLLDNQKAFLAGLTVAGRRQRLKGRSTVRIPEKVQFVCVVAASDGNRRDDGMVPCASQWPADLQEQGIPAVALQSSHRQAVRGAAGARLLADLVVQEQRRWTPEAVRRARQDVLGPEKTDPR